MKLSSILLASAGFIALSTVALADPPSPPAPPQQAVPNIVDQLYTTLNGLSSSDEDSTINNSNHVTLTRNLRTQLQSLLQQLSSITKAQHDTIEQQKKTLDEDKKKLSGSDSKVKDLTQHLQNQSNQIISLQQKLAKSAFSVPKITQAPCPESGTTSPVGHMNPAVSVPGPNNETPTHVRPPNATPPHPTH